MKILSIILLSFFNFYTVLPMEKLKVPVNNVNEQLIRFLRQKNSESAKNLIKTYNVNVNGSNSLLNTPLSIVLDNNDFELAQLLIDYGADLEKKLFKGYTLLHSFANKPTTLKFLLDAGAKNFYDVNDYGETPLDKALQLNNLEALALMQFYGADIFDPSIYAVKNLLDKINFSSEQLNLLIEAAQKKFEKSEDEKIKAQFIAIKKLLNNKKIFLTLKTSIEQSEKSDKIFLNAAADGNVYVVKYFLSLPFQTLLDKPTMTLRLALHIAKGLQITEKIKFIKEQYQEIEQAVKKNL